MTQNPASGFVPPQCYKEKVEALSHAGHIVVQAVYQDPRIAEACWALQADL